MSTEPKLCKDCKFFKDLGESSPVYPSYRYSCSSKVIEKISLIDGTKYQTGWTLCREQRYSKNPEDCGEEGRLWQPRESQ